MGMDGIDDEFREHIRVAIATWLRSFDSETRILIVGLFITVLIFVVVLYYLFERRDKHSYEKDSRKEYERQVISRFVSRRRENFHVVSGVHEASGRRITLASFSSHEDAARFVVEQGVDGLRALLEEKSSLRVLKPVRGERSNLVRNGLSRLENWSPSQGDHPCLPSPSTLPSLKSSE